MYTLWFVKSLDNMSNWVRSDLKYRLQVYITHHVPPAATTMVVISHKFPAGIRNWLLLVATVVALLVGLTIRPRWHCHHH